MSQASLNFDEFRTAYELGKSGAGKVMADNFLRDLIRQFAGEERVKAFPRDAKLELELIEDTLDEAAKLQEAESEIDLLIKMYTGIKTGISDKIKGIIDLHVESGQLEEGLFRVVPIPKKENRKVNIQKIKSEYPDKFDLLLKLKLDDITENYVPTIKECEFVFKKRVGEVLIQAGEKIVGYELVPLMPEKAAEVPV